MQVQIQAKLLASGDQGRNWGAPGEPTGPANVLAATLGMLSQGCPHLSAQTCPLGMCVLYK